MASGYTKENMGFKADLYSKFSDPRLVGQFFSYNEIRDMFQSRYPSITTSVVSKAIMAGHHSGEAPWEHVGKGLIKIIGVRNEASDFSDPEPALSSVENFLLMKRLAKLDDGTLLVQDDDTMKVYKLQELS